MRVLITGGAGNLGRVLAPVFERCGFAVTLTDRVAAEDGRHVELADVVDADAMLRLVDGHDVVVHAAALHGPQMPVVAPAEFVQVNQVGTYNVLSAAARTKVRRVVFMSSTAVYGVAKDASGSEAIFCDEQSPVRPRDINDLCKVLGEQVCEYFSFAHALDCVRLRCGRFFVEDELSFNLAKLSGAIDVADVAEAVRLASTVDIVPPVLCVSSPTAFRLEDAADLAVAPELAVERRYPGSVVLLRDAGLCLPATIHRVIDTSLAQTTLGFEARSSFAAFLDSLGERQGLTVQGVSL